MLNRIAVPLILTFFRDHFSGKPIVVWRVIVALREEAVEVDRATIPECTLVMNRNALAGTFGPTLMPWMQLLVEELAIAAAESAAVAPSAPGGSVAAASASSSAGARL